MAAPNVTRIPASLHMPNYHEMREEAASRAGVRRRLFVSSDAATQDDPSPPLPMTFDAAAPLPPFDWDWMRAVNGASRGPFGAPVS